MRITAFMWHSSVSQNTGGIIHHRVISVQLEKPFPCAIVSRKLLQSRHSLEFNESTAEEVPLEC